jgi:hypothetical protein
LISGHQAEEAAKGMGPMTSAVEEEASKLGGLRQEDPGSKIGKQRHEVWEKHVAALGRVLTDFVEAAARKHRRLDDAITEIGRPASPRD